LRNVPHIFGRTLARKEVFETLAYGEILAQSPPESLLRTLMEAQHRRTVGRVAAGEIPSHSRESSISVSPASFGLAEPAVPTTPQSVDDLIEAYLRSRRRRTTR
jgi:hypothetical protein